MPRIRNTLSHVFFILFLGSILFVFSCRAPEVENIFRKERRFAGINDLPVALLTSEWAGKAKILASGWLVDGSNGILLSARHFSDGFMDGIVELGGSECKAFLAGKVYDCSVLAVPPLRDAVLIKLNGFEDRVLQSLAYKISNRAVRRGETLYIRGQHPHPVLISESNLQDGSPDFLLSIFRDFYRARTVDINKRVEISYDNLEAVVASVSERVQVNDQENDPLGRLKYEENDYFKVATKRNHKFSFGGLSGGVVVRCNGDVCEAVGIVTAERPVRFEYDKKGDLKQERVRVAVFDTIMVTPIGSVADLVVTARNLR